MRLMVYLLAAIVTYYVAGMYRSLPLMLLFVMELVLLTLMRILPFYLRWAFSLEFVEQNMVVGREAEAICRIRVRNHAYLPVSRFRIRISLHYRQGGRRIVKRLYGGVRERGEDSMEFRLALPYCGLVLLELDKVEIYDYLSLFSVGKRVEEEIQVAVFPQETPLRLELSSSVYQEDDFPGEQAVFFRGKEQQQIRQLREYSEGDSVRLIHWNQSARTEKLWVKEYESEEEICVNLFLEMSVSGRVRQERVHVFYELLSALVLGLLEHAALVRIYWQEKQVFLDADIRRTEDLWDMLLHFYHMDFPRKKKIETVILPPQFSTVGNLLRFNMELELYHKERLIYRFSRKDFEKEIENRVYVI